MKKSIIQFIKFGMVGIVNTVVSTAANYIVLLFGVNYIIANTVGFFVGTMCAFLLNNRFVFKKEKNEERSMAKTGTKVFASYGISFLLSTVLLIFWVDVLGISKYIAPVINVCITTPLNFFMNKFWAFRDKGKEEEKNE